MEQKGRENREEGAYAVPTPTRSIRYASAYELLGNGDETRKRRDGRYGAVENGVGENVDM